MYEAIDDPYCYRGSRVLINKLGIRDSDRLEAFEAEITRERASEPLPPAA
jgi:cell filamentation protein